MDRRQIGRGHQVDLAHTSAHFGDAVFGLLPSAPELAAHGRTSGPQLFLLFCPSDYLVMSGTLGALRRLILFATFLVAHSGRLPCCAISPAQHTYFHHAA